MGFASPCLRLVSNLFSTLDSRNSKLLTLGGPPRELFACISVQVRRSDRKGQLMERGWGSQNREDNCISSVTGTSDVRLDPRRNQIALHQPPHVEQDIPMKIRTRSILGKRPVYWDISRPPRSRMRDHTATLANMNPPDRFENFFAPPTLGSSVLLHSMLTISVTSHGRSPPMPTTHDHVHTRRCE
ncbi:hypothetical protein BU25DRAFT_417039 [Macroventuria anomochaeta]|uniref:Uncharacterized protein n=1 Tax=Macroventuria anomochaeta TaxID=301207 RepID=A0ACB6SHT0_9PLEO|nr:uncharacterized protein BU25DRAFT_417039 [Macroventuria anomochaeta]KAF2633906.1 hypothetical protein BU25DRAFT_417039 [Macroventuria anomochaeta]